MVGKKVAKQSGVHENYWGKTIIDVYNLSEEYGYDQIGFVIKTDADGNNIFIVDSDFKIEFE